MNAATDFSAPRTSGASLVVVVAAALAIAILAAQIPTLLQVAAMPNLNGRAGIDYTLYMDASRRWLETGVFYEPHQLTGPYHIVHGDVLYPPVGLWLFVPFTLLPAALWWAIPLGLTAWVIVGLRPGPLAWPLMAACVAWQPGQIHIISGNPVMWSMAAVALATLHPWAAPFAVLKASLFPFALFRINRRSWWVGLAAFAALSVPFLPMWFDWLRAVINSSGGGLWYSWQEAPLLLLPIIAWAARPGGRYGGRSLREPASDLRPADVG